MEKWRNFFIHALPCLYDFLKENGIIYLPNMDCVQMLLNDSMQTIGNLYSITAVVDPLENPLYKATSLSDVEGKLIKFGKSGNTNGTECSKLNSASFFLKFQKKTNSVMNVTPSIVSEDDDTQSDVGSIMSVIPSTTLPQEMVNLKTIHVYVGSAEPAYNQVVSFTSAFNSSPFFGRYAVTYLTHVDVKNRGWGMNRIFQWLYQCNMHVILCHMHQGKKGNNNGVWDCTSYLLNLNNLQSHVGIPMGEQLDCSMFNQHKMHYILSLKEISIPSLFVAMNNFDVHEESNSSATNLIYFDKNKIFRWNNTDEVIAKLKELGFTDEQFWVLKFPFKTNKDCMKYALGFEALAEVIKLSI